MAYSLVKLPGIPEWVSSRRERQYEFELLAEVDFCITKDSIEMNGKKISFGEVHIPNVPIVFEVYHGAGLFYRVNDAYFTNVAGVRGKNERTIRISRFGTIFWIEVISERNRSYTFLWMDPKDNKNVAHLGDLRSGVLNCGIASPGKIIFASDKKHVLILKILDNGQVLHRMIPRTYASLFFVSTRRVYFGHRHFEGYKKRTIISQNELNDEFFKDHDCDLYCKKIMFADKNLQEIIFADDDCCLLNSEGGLGLFNFETNQSIIIRFSDNFCCTFRKGNFLTISGESFRLTKYDTSRWGSMSIESREICLSIAGSIRSVLGRRFPRDLIDLILQYYEFETYL